MSHQSWFTGHRGRLGAAAMAMFLAAVVAPGTALLAPASAAPALQAPIAPGAKYVALGDSFAAGTGVPQIIDPGCSRSDSNYPRLVANELRLELTDVTCGGATINNIVDTPQRTASGSRDPQIQAVTSDTDLVTITIGGNDVNYTLDLFRNSCDPGDPGVPDQIEPSICGTVDPNATNLALAGVESELTNMLSAIQQRAPRARIVFLDRLTNLPQNGQPCDGLPLTSDEISYSKNVAAQLQTATKNATRQADVELIQISKASIGHSICTQDPWAYDFRFDPALTNGIGAYHPNAAGTRATADLLVRQLQCPLSTMLDLPTSLGSSAGSSASCI